MASVTRAPVAALCALGDTTLGHERVTESQREVEAALERFMAGGGAAWRVHVTEKFGAQPTDGLLLTAWIGAMLPAPLLRRQACLECDDVASCLEAQLPLVLDACAYQVHMDPPSLLAATCVWIP